ncbi:hypothetical protein WKI65_22335 [Streptomyces sp. MS1.AVA.3]|uniref:hypothetical protein n=1 Tax=Streptomyces TaxID=1883 RepID=UPI00237DB186|nr:hypothetical protein [Streptomyces sp. G7(2002)]WDT53565.1 hypothetical protein NUT86_05625 [Streptomyces sp. G7(2002)]
MLELVHRGANGNNSTMQPPVIAAIVTATVALITAAFTAVNSQRQHHRSQQNNWLHERRKDAYLHFIDAARAFLPLTELAVQGEVHSDAEPPTDDFGYITTDGDLIASETVRTSAILYIANLTSAELSDEWYQKAPGKLTELTAAWDRVHMNGDEDLRVLAREINNLAHCLLKSRQLIPLEQKQFSPEEENVPGRAELLRMNIRDYHTKTKHFREKAREDLDTFAARPVRLSQRT